MSGLSRFSAGGLALLFLFAVAPVLAEEDAESPEARRARMLETYDADGDGQLSGPERESMRAARREQRGGAGGFHAKADTDGDGKVSDEERKIFRESRAAKAKERHAERLKAFDADGDGQLSEDERAAMRAKRGGKRGEHHKRMIERFDTDGDGSLSDEERAAAREQMRRKRTKRGAEGGPGQP